MISKKVEKEINQQINAEMFSAYLYLSMSAYFESTNFPGFANWMKIQAQEELMHAMKLYAYLAERGGRITLTAITAPKTEWENATEVFSEVLKHEKQITTLIDNLMNIAIAEKDHATATMLQWFINEQVEEESIAEKILNDIKLIGTHGPSLLMLDRELGRRSFTGTQQ